MPPQAQALTCGLSPKAEGGCGLGCRSHGGSSCVSSCRCCSKGQPCGCCLGSCSANVEAGCSSLSCGATGKNKPSSCPRLSGSGGGGSRSKHKARRGCGLTRRHAAWHRAAKSKAPCDSRSLSGSTASKVQFWRISPGEEKRPIYLRNIHSQILSWLSYRPFADSTSCVSKRCALHQAYTLILTKTVSRLPSPAALCSVSLC